MENNTIRTMPANVQAEQSILAIMFYDEKNIPRVFERLTAAQVRQLQKIFSVISSRIDPEDRFIPALR